MIRNYRFGFSGDMKADNQQGSTFDFEVHYITDYISNFFRKHKEYKLQYKAHKERITELLTVIGNYENLTTMSAEGKIIFDRMTVSYDEINTLRKTNRANKILDFILKSSCNFENYLPGTQLVFEKAIESFKDNNYKNIWVHKKKVLKDIGKVQLVCELTAFEFNLDLVIEDKTNIIYKKNIYKKMPDTIFYYHKFDDLIVEDDFIHITDRIYKKPIVSVAMKEILKTIKNNSYFPEEDSRYTPVANSKDPKWWNDFKKCMREPEGYPCLKL